MSNFLWNRVQEYATALFYFRIKFLDGIIDCNVEDIAVIIKRGGAKTWFDFTHFCCVFSRDKTPIFNALCSISQGRKGLESQILI